MVENFDLIIVGAGIAGIGVARRLREKKSNKSFVILDARSALGGTWDQFRYPGVRSDSDMFTMCYEKKPWTGDDNIVSAGSAILSYLNEAVDEMNIRPSIRLNHKVKSASWSEENSQWNLIVESNDAPQKVMFAAKHLVLCTGYFDYDKGHTPQLPGLESFQGKVIHPQFWPQDLDYSRQRVAVIGSGATAMTLIPELANVAGHVVMIQRSPTYVLSWPKVDVIAMYLNKMMPRKVAFQLVRWKNILFQSLAFKVARRFPSFIKKMLLKRVEKSLGPDFDVQKHFTPTYQPWDQRLCAIPNGDLFSAIKSGKASVVTGHINKIEPKGIRLESGQFIPADIVVTATGLELSTAGKIELYVEGNRIDPANSFTYKGMMLSDLPNLFFTFGYISASWTLRVELFAEYICRVLTHMDEKGYKVCVPLLPEKYLRMKPQALIKDFTAGYIQRGVHLMPKQGDVDPWRSSQNYLLDRKIILNQPVGDDALHFGDDKGYRFKPSIPQSQLDLKITNPKETLSAQQTHF